MTLGELYLRHITTWPTTIYIGDGYKTGDGLDFPTLGRVYHAIESDIDLRSDHWGALFAWSVFQACHEYARQLLQAGLTEMNVRDVPMSSIDRYMWENMKGRDWDQERADYNGMA